MEITFAEAYTNIVHVNLDIKLNDQEFTYLSTWIGGTEEEFEVTNEEFTEVGIEEENAIHAAAHKYLLTIHKDADGNVLNGGLNKMDELLDNIQTDI